MSGDDPPVLPAPAQRVPRPGSTWQDLARRVERGWRLLTRREDVYREPRYLRVFCNQRYSAYGEQLLAGHLLDERYWLDRLQDSQEMDYERFTQVLARLPKVRTVEFSGRGEPLLNPHLFSMIAHAHERARETGRPVETVVVTNGQLLRRDLDRLLASPLSWICVQLYGHKPSMYRRMSGLDAHNFVVALDNLKALLAARRAANSPLRVTLLMSADIDTYTQIPDMLLFAYGLGVDDVVIGNHLPSEAGVSSPRTLYRDQPDVSDWLSVIQSCLDHLRPMQVTLPMLLDRHMQYHRQCREIYTTVAVEGNGDISPCSRQAIAFDGKPSIADPNFWRHPHYQTLRRIHPLNTCQDSAAASLSPVPSSCHYCPHNMPDVALNGIDSAAPLSAAHLVPVTG